MSKRPRITNLGGIHIFNPPEPNGNTTNLNGVMPGSIPAGGCMNIPDFFRLEVEGDEPSYPYLTGRHTLIRASGIVSNFSDFTQRQWLGAWLGDPIPDEPDLGLAGYFQWVMFYGFLDIDEGPYAPFESDASWWLAANVKFAANFVAESVSHLYRFIRPELAADEEQGRLPIDSDDYQHFDALQPNVFFSEGHTFGGPEEAVAGQEFITIRPFYP